MKRNDLKSSSDGLNWEARKTLAAEESEQRYRSLFENMIDGYAYCRMIFEHDKPVDFVYLETNKSFEKLTGLKGVVGKKVTEVIPGIRETNPELFEIYGRVALAGQAERFETFVEPLKSWFAVSVYSPARETFTAVFENITARKRDEERLKRDEMRLQSLLDISNYETSNIQQLLDVALDKAISLTESKIGYIYHYSEQEEEFTLNTWSKDVMKECNITNPQTTYQLDKTGIWGEAVRQRKPIVVNDFQSQNPLKKGYPEGHARLYSFLTLPVIVDDRIVAVIGVANKDTDYDQADLRQLTLLTDAVWKIIERRRAEEKINNLNTILLSRTTELEAVNKELEAFSYSVSHDLRAPLRALDGLSMAMLEDYANELDEQGKNYLGRIRKASQLMSRLIDDMLRLSRIGRAETYFSQINLSDLIKSIAKGLQNSQPERTVEFKISPDIKVKGDAQLLQIAINNLLENAWKFTGKCAKSRIEAGVTQKDGNKVYFIKDNGTGFDMQYANNLFQPFQRLHSDKEYEGTGVGLAIVQRIIRRHGGRIWAESHKGQGATFYFTLG